MFAVIWLMSSWYVRVRQFPWTLGQLLHQASILTVILAAPSHAMPPPPPPTHFLDACLGSWNARRARQGTQPLNRKLF